MTRLIGRYNIHYNVINGLTVLKKNGPLTNKYYEILDRMENRVTLISNYKQLLEKVMVTSVSQVINYLLLIPPSSSSSRKILLIRRRERSLKVRK